MLKRAPSAHPLARDFRRTEATPLVPAKAATQAADSSAGLGCAAAVALAIAGFLFGGASAAPVILLRLIPDVFDVVDAFYFVDLHCP